MRTDPASEDEGNMRLICPNCGAQYEVPDDAIPQAGRDVQCSNCGHTWFEMPGASAAEEAGEAASPAPKAADPSRAGPVRDPGAPHPDEDDYEDEGDNAPLPDPEQPAARQRRPIDPAVADVLREERETSTSLRRKASADPMERQSEMGLEESQPPRSRPEPRPTPRPEPEEPHEPASSSEPEPVAEPETDRRDRRDRLPDVEEINSTLRASGDRPSSSADVTPAEAAEREHRKGFRYGFAVVLLLASAATAVYLYAADIAERFPETQPALVSYTESINTGRLWLDAQLQDLVTMIEGEDEATAQ
ncbi:zinc-ribbon domain-containing protein [Histidinibacterium aquaticum]|uniref:Thioredoxin n=1 Tax=Histidinibacterium aquaticum TaxID=2613962 RepID=A0A5J5GQA5_9RHOB|nr:zinc-ribbon domain-containing protein [Histidinibacterium aquaticum]KAA9010539.1 thioredoxin [Histidinibacterium aquaticum]